MKPLEIKILPLRRQMRNQLMIHHRHTLDARGQLTVDLVRNLSIAAVPDGIGPNGDQVHRMLESREVVVRAVEIAEHVYAEIERRNWLIETPSLDELELSDPEITTGFTSK